MSSDSPAISTRRLSKSYRLGRSVGYGRLTESLSRLPQTLRRRAHSSEDRSFWALKDVTFDAAQGEAVGIIGPNGAGKSTLLKILSRVTRPTAGSASIRGRVGSLLDVGTGFHPELSGKENVFLSGAILGLTRREIARRYDEIVDFSEIEEFIDVPVKRYSSGMRVRLGFAVAAHMEPEILVVDEVLAVGDASFQRKSMGKLTQFIESGRTVLLVSHNLTSIESFCHRAILLERGQLSMVGPPSDVVNQYTDSSAAINTVALRDREDRHGLGRIRLSDAWLERLGQRSQSLVTGEPGAICLRFETDGVSGIVDASITVSDILGAPVTLLWSTMADAAWPNVPAKGIIRCDLPKVAFLPGTYQLGLCVSVGGEPHDLLIDGLRMTVEAGDYFGSGQIPSSAWGALVHEQMWRLDGPSDEPE